MHKEDISSSNSLSTNASVENNNNNNQDNSNENNNNNSNDNNKKSEQHQPGQREINEFLQAAEAGNQSIIVHLLEKYQQQGQGVGVNPAFLRATDENGNTALHHACLRDHQRLAVYLVEKGFDPAVQNAQGKTALQLANPRLRGMLKATLEICEIYAEVEREGAL